MESTQQRSWFGRTDIIPWPWLFGMYSTRTSKSRNVVDNYRNMFESRISAGALDKLPVSKKSDAHISSWYYDMERNVWKDIANWQTKQRKNYTKSQLHVLTTISSKKKKWDQLENFARRLFWHVYTWHVLEGLLFDGPWTNLLVQFQKWTWSWWQSFGAFDLLQTSHKWIQFSFGKYSTTTQRRIVSRLRFCRRPWRLKVDIRWNFVHFRKPYICANKLDVLETDISFTQLNGSWSHFSWCRFTHGRYSRAWSLGFGYWSVAFFTKTDQQNHIC